MTPSDAGHLAGVILAAGESSRMGREKALLPFDDDTLLSAAIKSLQAFVQVVIVVAGENAGAVEPIIRSAGAQLVINPTPKKGQFSSLRVGLAEALRRGFSEAFITHVDRPPASASTFQSLLKAFTTARQMSGEGRKWAVVPQIHDRHGHPILASEELIQAFLRAPDHLTAREVEHEHQHRILYLNVDDENIVTNLNTPEEYERLTRGSQSSK